MKKILMIVLLLMYGIQVDVEASARDLTKRQSFINISEYTPANEIVMQITLALTYIKETIKEKNIKDKITLDFFKTITDFLELRLKQIDGLLKRRLAGSRIQGKNPLPSYLHEAATVAKLVTLLIQKEPNQIIEFAQRFCSLLNKFNETTKSLIFGWQDTKKTSEELIELINKHVEKYQSLSPHFCPSFYDIYAVANFGISQTEPFEKTQDAFHFLGFDRMLSCPFNVPEATLENFDKIRIVQKALILKELIKAKIDKLAIPGISELVADYVAGEPDRCSLLDEAPESDKSNQ